MPQSPDRCLTIIDQEGIKYGKTPVDSHVVTNKGIQILSRSYARDTYGNTNEYSGYAKLSSILETLDSLSNEDIYIASPAPVAVYTLQSVIRVGEILPLGREVESSVNRYQWSVNLLLVLRRVT